MIATHHCGKETAGERERERERIQKLIAAAQSMQITFCESVGGALRTLGFFSFFFYLANTKLKAENTAGMNPFSFFSPSFFPVILSP